MTLCQQGLCSLLSSEDKGKVAPATSHIGPLPHALVAPEVMVSTVSNAVLPCTSVVHPHMAVSNECHIDSVLHMVPSMERHPHAD